MNDDLISRRQAIEAIEGITSSMSICVNSDECHGMKRMQRQAVLEIANMPSAQPEPHYDEWCTDCKEYDQERHCCPRWNRVIRQTMQDIKAESCWIPCSERLPEEGHDVLITKESFKIKGYEQKVIKAKRSVDPRSGEIKWWSPEFGTLTNKAVYAWMPLPKPWEGTEE